MNDVFKASSKAPTTTTTAIMSSELNDPDLDVLPPPKREGNCFQCCFPKQLETSRDVPEEHKVVEEEKMVVEEEEKVVVEEETPPRDFDLPDLSEDEFHDSTTDGKGPSVETQANFVLTLWQFLISMIFFEFLEKNRKRHRGIASEQVAAQQQAAQQQLMS